MTNARDMLGEFPAQGPKIKDRIDNLEGQLQQAQQNWARHMEALNQVRGALTECRYWIGLTPHGGDARLLPPVLMPPPPLAPTMDESIHISGHVPLNVHTLPLESPNGAAAEALDVEAAHV